MPNECEKRHEHEAQKMKLNENIDNNLKWKGQEDKISVIVLLQFEGDQITVKRLGTTDMVNLVEIKE